MVVLCFIVLICTVESVSGKDDNIRAKARHFFLKGNVKEAEGKMDEAYEYYKKAYKTDSTYKEAAYNYALGRLNRIGNTFDTDSNEMKENLRFLKNLADSYPHDPDYSETYAFYLIQSDSVKEALDVYRKLIQRRPGLSRLYLTQAYLFGINEDTDSAVNAMRQYERLEGISSESTLRKASYHLAKGDTVAALQEFRTYAESNPQDIETLMSVSMAYTLLGQQDSAYTIVKGAAARYPDNQALKFEMALIAKEAGDIDEFYKASREVLLSPDLEDEIKVNMLEDYLENLPGDSVSWKNTDTLLEEMSKTLGEELPFLRLYANYGILKKDMNLAYENVKKSYALSGDDPDMLGSVMTFAAIAGKPQEALTYYDNYTGEGKKDYNLILTYITAAENAMEYDKGVEAADTLLGEYLPDVTVRKGNITPDMIEEVAAEKAALASSVYEVTAELFSKLNRKDDVVRCYENAIILDGNNASVKNNYAYYTIETLKIAPGTPRFEKAKKMSYETLTGQEVPYYYYDTYAWILFKERDYKEALKYQELAIEKAGSEITGELLDHYGDILFMNDRPEEALKQWEKAIELEPDNALTKKKVDNKTIFYE